MLVALVRIESGFRNGAAGAGLRTFHAAVAERFPDRLVEVERRVRDDEAVAHERAVLLIDDLPVQCPGTDPAGLRRLSKVNDDVGRRFSGRDGFRVDEFVGARDFRVRALVALDAEVRHRLLQAGVVARVFNDRADFEQEDLGHFLVNVLHAERRIAVILVAVLHRAVQAFRHREPKADDRGRARQNAPRVSLRIRLVVHRTDADDLRPEFQCFFLNEFRSQFHGAHLSIFHGFPVRNGFSNRPSMQPPFFSSIDTQARMQPPHFAIL